MAENYYLDLDGKTAGPFTADQVQKLLQAGTVNGDTLYSTAGAVQWVPLSSVMALFGDAPGRVPPVAAPPAYAPPAPVAARPFRTAGRRDFVCLDCGSVSRPKLLTRGSFAVELALWLLFCAPGLIYSLWRLCSKAKVCGICNSARIIPPHSPQGRAILAGEPPASLRK